MRDSNEIRAEITGIRDKLKTLDQSIKKKQQELGKLKESHAQWVESNIGKERMPKSIGKQRESMLSQSLEIENLQIVQGNLESKLADLQLELARSELYENQVQSYKQAEQLFVDKAEKALQGVVDLNKKMQSCRASIEEFMQGPAIPTEFLKAVVNAPTVEALSLRDFFLGQIVEGGSEENAAFVRELVKIYRELARKLPILNSIKSDWVQLSNHLDFVSRTANDLTPRTIKYTASDQSPPPVQKSSKAIHINPRNLIAPEADRKREIEAMERKQYVRTITQQ